MTSDASSPTPPKVSLRLILRVPNYPYEEPGKNRKRMMPCVPSWNQVVSVETWGRAKLKQKIQDAFLSALRAAGADSSTRTIFARSTLSTAADTLACYQATVLAKRKLKSASKKLEAKQRSARS